MKPASGEVVVAYTDGSISKNPGGFGSYATVLILERNGVRYVEEIGFTEVATTNNRMEMKGVLQAMLRFSEPTNLLIFSDSQYVVRGLNEWLDDWMKTGALDYKANSTLWMELDKARRFHKNMEIEWVRGHNGNVWNERADEIAGELRKSADPAAFHFRRYEEVVSQIGISQI